MERPGRAGGRLAFIVLLFSCFATGESQETPLVSRDLEIHDGLIEFRLVNTGAKPITAWRVKIAMTVEGDLVATEFAKDFAISTGALVSGRNAVGSHHHGPLRPFDFHFHRLPVTGRPDEVNIQVSTVIFEDLTSIGIEEEVNRFFDDRRTLREECEQLLTKLDEMLGEAPRELQGELLGLAENLEGQVDLRRRASAPKKSDGIQKGLARSIRQSLQLLSNAEGDGAATALQVVSNSLRRQVEALRRHTPSLEGKVER